MEERISREKNVFFLEIETRASPRVEWRMDNLDFVIADIKDILVDKELCLKASYIEVIEEIERKVVGWLN